MGWPHHITVATIIHDQNRFLVVEEVDQGRRVYNQPAGHLEPGETLADAAIRETLEETGWRVSLDSVVGIYVYTSPEQDITYHRICYSGTPLRQETTDLDPDIVRSHWLNRDEIATLHTLRSPLVLLCIDDFVSGASYPMTMIREL